MIYFASDIHLGLKFGNKTPLQREKIFCSFLEHIKKDATHLYLVGDIFDFWFEWNKVVPQGFVRTLSKLAELTDSGIKVHFLTGNHDLWINKYFSTEIGIELHKGHIIEQINGKTLYISHADKLYDQKGFSWVVDKLFRSNIARWIAQRVIHPDLMLRFGQSWSQSNRNKKKEVTSHTFLGEQDNWTIKSRQILENSPQHIDYFVFGHLHTPIDYKLQENCRMIVLGEWIQNPVFATMDSQGEITLCPFEHLEV